jgi:hypothetical protein
MKARLVCAPVLVVLLGPACVTRRLAGPGRVQATGASLLQRPGCAELASSLLLARPPARPPAFGMERVDGVVRPNRCRRTNATFKSIFSASASTSSVSPRLPVPPLMRIPRVKPCSLIEPRGSSARPAQPSRSRPRAVRDSTLARSHVFALLAAGAAVAQRARTARSSPRRWQTQMRLS